MSKFKTSRLSNGNLLFPIEIILSNNITIKTPNLISNNERVILFSRVSSVSVSTPVIGFSSITIETNGESLVLIHGFYKREVEEISKLILNKM